MKKELTELVFILDRSGSMDGLVSDTIGGFNSMLKKQIEVEGDCMVTTVLFDDKYELLHNRIEIKEIDPISEREYFVRGTTALLDAVGKTINSIGSLLNNTSENERPEKVMFVIITDGLENASIEFSKDKIKEMIEHQREKYNWEFIFLGANIDAVNTAEQMGICKRRAANYIADSKGTTMNFSMVSDLACYMRKSDTPPAFMKKYFDDKISEIDEDYKKRSKKK